MENYITCKIIKIIQFGIVLFKLHELFMMIEFVRVNCTFNISIPRVYDASR